MNKLKDYLDRHLKQQRIIAAIYILILPVLLFFGLEILNAGGFVVSAAVKDFRVLLISWFAILLIAATVYSLCGNLPISFSAALLLLGTLYIVNYFKYEITGWVLVPDNLGFANNLGSIVGFADIRITRAIRNCVFVLGVSMLPTLYMQKIIKVGARPRMAMFSASIAILLFVFGTKFSEESLLPLFNVNMQVRKIANTNYRDHGVLLGFYMEARMQRVDEPVKYSAEMMESIHGELAGLKRDEPVAARKKPNVIVVMSEAFTDPARLKSLEYSSDPTPVIHGLMENGAYASGNVITPAFGGSTCNPEWEFLTGNLLYFNTSNSTPFVSHKFYISKPDPRSLPNQFRNNGYKTVGLHPYYSSFFNRSEIYPRLGFDEFITAENMEDAPKKGEFISDDYMTDRILDKLKETEEPLFLYAISMQNHYEYFPGKYGQTDIKVTDKSGLLTEKDIGTAETYIQGIHDADAALGRLISELEKSDEDTVVLFFGDHCPILSQPALELFNKLGFVNATDMFDAPIDEYYLLFTTPYIIWANYELPDSGIEFGDMSAYFAGALISRLAGIEQNEYFNFLTEAYGEFHGYKENLYVDQDGKLYDSPVPEDKQLIEKLYAIQYDYIFGSRYVAGNLSE